MEILDINNDGTLDYISLADNRSSSIWLNGNSITSYYINTARFLKAFDVDHDGDLDIIAANKAFTNGIVWLENANTKFIDHTIDNSAYDYRSLAVFDADGDGDEDVFAACFTGCGIHLFENTGAGNFKFTNISSTGAASEQSLIQADINGDGILDIVKDDQGSHIVTWLQNTTSQFSGIDSDFLTIGKCQGDTIYFKQTARGKNIISWSWDFGDGSPLSTELNPIHAYQNSGTYNIKLKVTNATGETNEMVKQLSIIAAPPKSPDLEVPLCNNSAVVTLPATYSYEWYFTATSTYVASTNNTMTIYYSGNPLQMTFYIVKEDLTTGCRSVVRDKVVGKYYGYPQSAKPVGAFSQIGPATLMLSATGGSGESVEWYNQPDLSVPFQTGNFLTKYFDKTTTYFVRSVNAGGCKAPLVSVTAEILPAPVPSPQFIWAGNPKIDTQSEGYDIATDPNGNVVVYGYWVSGKFIVGKDTLRSNANEVQRFAMTYDKSGNPLKAIKIIRADNAYYNLESESMIIDKQGNIFLSLVTNVNLTIGGTSIIKPTDQTRYCVIAKLNPQGVLQWYKIFNGGNPEIKIDGQGNLYVIGSFNNQTTIDSKTIYGSSYACFLARFDPSGMINYVIAIPGSTSMAVDGSGNAYVGSTVVNSNSVSLAMSKYDPAGNQLWTKQVTSNGTINLGSSGGIGPIAIDAMNNVVLAGYFYTYREPWQLFSQPFSDRYATFLAKISPDGNPLWQKHLEGGPSLGAGGLEIDSNNKIFLSGRYGGSATFDGINLNQTANPTPFIARFDADGNPEWARDLYTYGSSYIYFNACIPDNQGGAFIGGSFVDYVTLDNINLTANTNTMYVDYNVLVTHIGYGFKSDFRTSSTCAGSPINFTDVSTTDNNHPIVSWEWDFGDGSKSNQQNPSYIYPSPGNYNVALTVTNQIGNKASSYQLISVASSAAVNVTLVPGTDPTTICKNDVTTYKVNLSNAGLSYSIQWFQDEVLEPSSSDKTSVQFSADKQKEIKVKIESFSQLCSVNRIGKDSVTQTAFAVPSAPQVNVSSTSLCANDFATASVVGQYNSYLWSTGETSVQISVSASTTQPLTVQVWNSSSCLSEAASASQIIFHDYPVVQIVFQNQLLNATQGFGSYTWYKDDVQLDITNDSFKPSESGSYKVEVTNSFGCKTLSAALDVLVTAVENNSRDIQMYPNPVTDKLQIRTDLSPLRIEISDSRGQKVFSEPYSSEIDMKAVASGIYIIELFFQDRTYRQKIIKIQ